MAVAYVAVADMKYAQWDIWSINDAEMAGSSDAFKTPSKVYAEGSWPIIVNAGFFYSSEGKNYSSSLAVRESEILAYNINYASEDWVTRNVDVNCHRAQSSVLSAGPDYRR